VRFFRIPSFTGIEAHRDDADRGSLRVVEGCLPYGPGGLRSGPVWKKVGEVSSLSNLDENHLYGSDDGKGNSALFISRTKEVHELAIISSENTKLESFGNNYLIIDPVEMYQEGKAVLAPVGNQLYSFGDGDGEAVFVGKQSKGVFPDEELYSYEWAKFPNCKFFVQGPKKTIYAAGNPDQPLRVYISEPASKTSPIKDSPYSTEEPVIDAYGGLLSVVDILGTNASAITALSSRGDQVVVHTNKGCHLLYAPTSDQAETGYRVEQAPATNFSAAVSSQVVAGETGSMSFWLGHDGQIYKDESAARGAEDVKNYADPAQVSWKSKSVWEKELHYDLRDSFAAYDRQSGMYWIYVIAPEYLDTIKDSIPGMVFNLETLPERPGQITNLTASGSSIPGNIVNFDASTIKPGNISDLIVLPPLPGKIEDLDAGKVRPSYVTDLRAMPPKPGQVDLVSKPIEPGDIDSIEAMPTKPGNIEDFKCLDKPGTVENLDVKPLRPGKIDLELEINRPGNVNNVDAKPEAPDKIRVFDVKTKKPGKVGTPGASPEKPVKIISLTAKPEDPDKIRVFDVETEKPGKVENVDAQTTTEKLSKPIVEMKVPEFMNPERMEFAVLWNNVENATYPEGYELQLDKYESGQELFNPPEEEYTPDTTGMYFSSMEANTIYAARVRAVGYGHKYLTSDWSDVKYYQTPRVKLDPIEELKAFYSAFNDDPAKDVTITWQNHEFASRHQLQISKQSDFSTTVIDYIQDPRGISLFIEEQPGSRLEAETTYYVRIRCSHAGNEYSTSDWSETVQYRTANEIPAPHTVLNVNARPERPAQVTGLSVEGAGAGYIDPNDYASDGAFFGTGQMKIYDNANTIRSIQGSGVLNEGTYPDNAPPTTPAQMYATGNSSSIRMDLYYPNGRVNGAAKTVDFCKQNSSSYQDGKFKLAPIAVTYEGKRDYNDLVWVNEYGLLRRRWKLNPDGTMPSWKIEGFDSQGSDEEAWVVFDPNQNRYTVLWFPFISTPAGRDYYPKLYIHSKQSSYDQSFHPSNPFGVYSYHITGDTDRHRSCYIFAPDFLDSCDPAHSPYGQPTAPVHITLPENSTLNGTSITNLQVHPAIGTADSEQCAGPNPADCTGNDIHRWYYNGTEDKFEDPDGNDFNVNNALYLTHIKNGAFGGVGAWVLGSGRYSGFGCSTSTTIPRNLDDAVGSGRESLHRPQFSQGTFRRSTPETSIFYWSESGWTNIPVGGGVARWWGRYRNKYDSRYFDNVYQYWTVARPDTRADTHNEWNQLKDLDRSSKARMYNWNSIIRHNDFGPDWREFEIRLYPSLAYGGRYMVSMHFGELLYGHFKNVSGTGCQITGEYRAQPNTTTPDDLSFWIGLRPFHSDGSTHRGGAYHSDGSSFTLPVNTTEWPWQ